MPRRTYLITGIAIAVLIIAGFVFVKQKGGNEAMAPTIETGEPQTQKPPSSEGAAVRKTVKIIYTDSGYSSSDAVINKDDVIVFENKSSRDFWPASAIHPTHKVYPGSDISKCGTVEETNIFDACRPISSGSSYAFIFNQLGSWKYHDHLNPSLTGTITVQ